MLQVNPPWRNGTDKEYAEILAMLRLTCINVESTECVYPPYTPTPTPHPHPPMILLGERRMTFSVFRAGMGVHEETGRCGGSGKRESHL